MRKIIAFVSIMMMIASASIFAQETEKTHTTDVVKVKQVGKNVIGYYTSWEWYKRQGLASPVNIDFSKYSIINYAYFKPDTLGNLDGMDAWADSILLRGLFDYSSLEQPVYHANTSLIDAAHVQGVKVLLSIGGWNNSNNFSKIAADSVNRANFAHNCVLMCSKYEFDGIDLNWEFPGSAEINGSEKDKQNFTLLINSVRDSLDAYGQKIKYKFLISAMFSPYDVHHAFIEWDKIKDKIDLFNVMTYDINGPWSTHVSHSSPLYSPSQGDTTSFDNSFRRLTKLYGIPSKKVNLGVGFNGRATLGKVGEKIDLYSTNHSGLNDTILFTEENGSTAYYNLILQKNKFDERWDEKAQVPYLIGKGDLNTFVSYENEKSLQLKTQYIKDNEAGGIVIWEISGDAIEKKPGQGFIYKSPLITAIDDNFPTSRKRKIAKRYIAPSKPISKKEKGWRKNAVKQNINKIYLFKKPTNN